MEKTEGKIRYGLIGIGAQGGSYARFLTNAPAPFPGMVCAPCPDNCALGALCDIDPEKEKMCKEQYPDVPFFKDWKDMIASGIVDPTKVCRSAIENASSVAAMVLTTESLVSDLPEKNAPAMPAAPDMGGMY